MKFFFLNSFWCEVVRFDDAHALVLGMLYEDECFGAEILLPQKDAEAKGHMQEEEKHAKLVRSWMEETGLWNIKRPGSISILAYIKPMLKKHQNILSDIPQDLEAALISTIMEENFKDFILSYKKVLHGKDRFAFIASGIDELVDDEERHLCMSYKVIDGYKESRDVSKLRNEYHDIVRKVRKEWLRKIIPELSLRIPTIKFRIMASLLSVYAAI
ncbi:MAG: hypothetical protein O2794_01505 [bacterium]|nr:hypothetical protein [bacterium]